MPTPATLVLELPPGPTKAVIIEAVDIATFMLTFAPRAKETSENAKTTEDTKRKEKSALCRG